MSEFHRRVNLKPSPTPCVPHHRHSTRRAQHYELAWGSFEAYPSNQTALEAAQTHFSGNGNYQLFQPASS